MEQVSERKRERERERGGGGGGGGGRHLLAGGVQHAVDGTLLELVEFGGLQLLQALGDGRGDGRVVHLAGSGEGAQAGQCAG